MDLKMDGKPGRRERLQLAIEPLIFARRQLALAVIVVLTLLFAGAASQLQIDAGFGRGTPADHPYTLVEKQNQAALGSANLVQVALIRKTGDIYDPAFLAALKTLTEALAKLPGVDRGQLRSLFTPELRYIDIVEGGFFGASVVPSDFSPATATPEQLAKLRANVAKADVFGRYVSADQRAALIEVAFIERDPATGKRLNQRELAAQIDKTVSNALTGAGAKPVAKPIPDFTVSVSGAPSLSRALAAELPEALMFAVISLLLLWVLLGVSLGSLKVAVAVVGCALVAVIWQLGSLKLLGINLDPLAAFAPAIVVIAAVMTGVQFSCSWLDELAEGRRSSFEASLQTWRRQAIPLATSLLAPAAAGIGLFVASDVRLLREIAVSVALGLLAAVVANGVLLPLLLSKADHRRQGRWRILSQLKLRQRAGSLIASFSGRFEAMTDVWPAIAVALISAALFGWSSWQIGKLHIASTAEEVNLLSSANPYQAADQAIARQFPRSVNFIGVMVDSAKGSCVRAEAMEQVDRLAWQLQNLSGVVGTQSLPHASKRVLTAFSEGSPKFAVLARNRETLTQAIAPIPPSSRLFNGDCSVLPVWVFVADRGADRGANPGADQKLATLADVVAQVEVFNRQNADEFYETHRDVDAAYCASRAQADGPQNAHQCPVVARLASGPLGAPLAEQQALTAFRNSALLILLAALALGIWLLLADATSLLIILLPLALTAFLVQALITAFGIALNSALLPLLVLATGIGLSSNIHLNGVSTIDSVSSRRAAVLIASFAIAIALMPWLFSGFQYQREFGLVLILTLLANLIGTLILLPVIARFTDKQAADG